MSLGFANPWLHRHNWLNGHLFARLHANGVCEVYAHHINSNSSSRKLVYVVSSTTLPQCLSKSK